MLTATARIHTFLLLLISRRPPHPHVLSLLISALNIDPNFQLIFMELCENDVLCEGETKDK
ncbi:hypothetical protein D3C76_1501770 [compost metagenome]